MVTPVSTPYHPSGSEQVLGASHRRALLATLLAVSLGSLDTAIANTALPAIAADLRASTAAAIWIINAYQMAIVATLLPFAALGDLWGAAQGLSRRPGLLHRVVAGLRAGRQPGEPDAGAHATQGIGASAIMSVNIALIRLI